MTPSDWQPTQSIRMSVQSAELSLISVKARQQLNVTCSLVNIARGHCMVTITPLPHDTITASGQLQIPVERPVMQLDVALARPAFERLTHALSGQMPRPASLIVMLDEHLMVNTAGDLLVDHPIDCRVADLSWIVPIQ